MKQTVLAVVGLAFALGFISGDQESKKREVIKQQEVLAKHEVFEKERQERRW